MTAVNASLHLIQAQWLNLARTPSYTLPTLLFPIMFYGFFGLLMIPGQALWLLCTFATFGVMGAALFSFGVGIATERAQGWLMLLRASPAPVGAVIAGKAFGALLFALIIAVVMSTMAAVFGGVRLATGQWLALAAVLVLGSLPFCLMGLALGLWLKPNAAPAVLNLIYLPLGFLSGLWIPTMQFPKFLQGIAEWLPPYHLAALALDVTGAKPADWAPSLIHLAVFTFAFAILTALGWKRLDGTRG
ncbi:ABC transporter permease [Wenzhouxiangella sp. XN79A]|uniref:ABC transporter permease n=1 Tax=Wenzhouxiangella sp. XN79A TaxID=2724193 RepID=UPI00144AD827|nr:ABC transporter permease [Wenzhouxiangella sp. XN79A]NKI36122.1 ABC transporter permease [Wenzhouxiangella sp. XN79A]